MAPQAPFMAQSLGLQQNTAAPTASGGGGIGLGGYTQLAAIGLDIYQAIQKRKAAEEFVRLTDERLRLEMAFAAQEEVHAVETLAFQQQVAFGQVFNTVGVESDSYVEAALANFGNSFDRRQQLFEQRMMFNRAKRFEAEDARRGVQGSASARIASSLQAGFAGYQLGASISGKIKDAQISGDMNALQSALFQQGFLQSDSQIRSENLQRQLYIQRIQETQSRLGGQDDSMGALTIGIPEKILAGAAPPSPGTFTTIFAANARAVQGWAF